VNIEDLHELGQATYFGNTLLAWARALLTFALWFTVVPLVRAFISRRIRRRTADHPLAFLVAAGTLLDATNRAFTFAVAIWLAIRWLHVPPAAHRFIDVAILVVVWWQVALWLTAALRHFIDARRGRELASAEGAASVNILRFVGTVVVWVIAVLMLLTSLDVKIGPLVAGLGIGGIAVALAVQNVLGDLFASMSIALDKPFRVGDFLVLGDEKGTVERIGIKSTRLRSLSGEQIVVSNGDLLKSRVRNYGLLYERRVSFSIGIVYETPRETVREVPALIEAAISAQEKTRFDRAHFASFGDSALQFEAVYYVLGAEYNLYMDIQQAINLKLMNDFAAHGIEFAYPTIKQYNVEASSA
jgi:small-conductance mechanosensitive channel